MTPHTESTNHLFRAAIHRRGRKLPPHHIAHLEGLSDAPGTTTPDAANDETPGCRAPKKKQGRIAVYTHPCLADAGLCAL